MEVDMNSIFYKKVKLVCTNCGIEREDYFGKFTKTLIADYHIENGCFTPEAVFYSVPKVFCGKCNLECNLIIN